MRFNSVIGRFYSYNPKRFRSSMLLAFVFFYFAFHLVTGERGLLAYVRLKTEMANKTEQSQLIQEQKIELSNRVTGMRDGSLDIDLLEEIARKDLGYSRKGEVVMFDENKLQN